MEIAENFVTEIEEGLQSGVIKGEKLHRATITFTLRVIFQCAFGLELESMPSHAFENLFPVLGARMASLLPLYRWGIYLGEERRNQDEIVIPTINAVKEAIRMNREALSRGEHPDNVLASLIIAADDSTQGNAKLSESELNAAGVVLQAAGFVSDLYFSCMCALFPKMSRWNRM